MIIAGLKGGLGNQMFQYALGRSLSIRNNDVLKIDPSFLHVNDVNADHTQRPYELEMFSIKKEIANDEEIGRLRNVLTRGIAKVLPSLTLNPYVKEKSQRFDPSVLALKGSRYLDGHWVSGMYFSEVEDQIRKDFTFRKAVIRQAEPVLSEIRQSSSVCLHVRRGDYVNNPSIAKVHLTTTPEYFERGIQHVSSLVDNPSFFVFSDDIKWCVEQFGQLKNVTFVEKELADAGATNNDYLQLMSNCKHFVISNSTFSWWGSWLSVNPSKLVIAPKKWLNTDADTSDVYQPNWIKL